MTKTCKHCGKEYEVIPAKYDRSKYCSRECINSYNQRITKQCLVCGKEFTCQKSQKERAKYCSVWCRKIGVAERLKGKKKNSPKTGEDIACKVCGKKFYAHKCEVKRKNKMYCSVECRNKDPNATVKQKGHLCHSWKGGRQKVQGYIYILSHDHPFKNSGGYVAEHRLVVEKHIGRYLDQKESVHHINGIKDDNRLENLQVVARSPHVGAVSCPFCNKEFVIR